MAQPVSNPKSPDWYRPLRKHAAYLDMFRDFPSKPIRAQTASQRNENVQSQTASRTASVANDKGTCSAATNKVTTSVTSS